MPLLQFARHGDLAIAVALRGRGWSGSEGHPDDECQGSDRRQSDRQETRVAGMLLKRCRRQSIRLHGVGSSSNLLRSNSPDHADVSLSDHRTPPPRRAIISHPLSSGSFGAKEGIDDPVSPCPPCLCVSFARSRPREIVDLTNAIIGATIEVHKRLGPGWLESAYRVRRPGIEELKTQRHGGHGGSRQVVSGLDIAPTAPSPQAQIIPSCWSGGRMLQASANRLY